MTLHDLDLAERMRDRARGERTGQPPTFSAKAGGVTLHKDRPLGVWGRLKRWLTGGR